MNLDLRNKKQIYKFALSAFFILFHLSGIFSINFEPQYKDESRFIRPSDTTGINAQIIDNLNIKTKKINIFIIKNGIYKNKNILISLSGNEKTPFIVMSETPGSVFLEGQSVIEITGNHVILEGVTFRNGYPASNKGAIVISGNYNRVTNCKIFNYNKHDKVTAEDLYETKWISLNNKTQHNEIDHCTFTGKSDRGSLLVVWRDNDMENHHNIHHNIFKDFRDPSEVLTGKEPNLPKDWKNQWETVRIGTGDFAQYYSKTILEYNYFEKCNGEVEIISNKSCGNIYRFNTFVECKGLLTLRNGFGCLVKGNYFITNGQKGAGGIRIIDKDHVIENNYIEGARLKISKDGKISMSGGIVIMANDKEEKEYRLVKNVIIRNNSIINCEGSFVYGTEDDSTIISPYSIFFENNIVCNNLDDSGLFDIINIVKNRYAQFPVYKGEVYYGSKLGLDKMPDGISFFKPDLIKNSFGQYLYHDLTKGAVPLYPLKEKDAGTNY